MSLFSAGQLDYWTRESVDQSNSMEISFITHESIRNNLLAQNCENKDDTKIRLGELRILLNIIGACVALSFVRLIYEIVYFKIRKK